ncbi:MAG: oxidoreductase [Candidatus Marinimicrobia bacterium CG1_02_48_14]|nr:MAG: oxidoreductase [Candidatus Marinimicrobia bacterium CG1_02_48_14]PIZ67845.1 MAG: oxidoreductase [Candidatus Marinimicrobia bacterium CG_4_10_14_0_2_um_filter_48_9]PJA55104.1 MAG: oxidoreductase [Candidatus Marinimicrobia bacterium CG_4_9_14_3_um_filter_48_9]
MSTQPFPDSPLSLWLETFGDYQPQPELKEHITVDVAVIGGGFTGVATAHELKKADPALNVALVEAKTVGYGASGRNGSFAMTVVGLGFGVTAMLRGKDYLQRAHRYMMQAVDGLEELIRTESLNCDMIRPGFLRAATTPAYIKRIQHDVKLMNDLGFDDIYWISQDEVRQKVNSDKYLGAMYEPRLLLINPAKLVRAERDLALRRGVQVYENTPVVTITSTPKFTITTPRGSITAEKVVFATNGYSHLFPQMKRKQIPAFTYMIATEQLSDEQLADIGWQNYEGVEDGRNLIHYYRLTPDNRIVLGGGPVGLTWGNSLYGDSDEAAWKHLEEHLMWLFPSLKKHVKITHRWGGPFSVTVNLSPALGYIGADKRAVYSVGCIGHGVSMSHRNGQALTDLILERESELLECPFVNPTVIPWPPEPLRMMTAGALRGYLQLEDWWYEREIS